MNRRDFIARLGGVAAAWPLSARAQPVAMPSVGHLMSSSPDQQRDAAIRRGLAEHGYVEGQNVTIESRYAHSRYDRLPAMLADLVQRRVAVILAGGNQAALAVKTARVTTPTVFSIGDDPVHLGLVTSLNRPSGSMTGVTFYSVALAEKRLGLLHEIVPPQTMIGMLVNPASPNSEAQLAEVQRAAVSLGRSIEVVRAGTPTELNEALLTLLNRRVGGFFYSTDPFFNAERSRLTAFAARNHLIAVFSGRQYIEAGALIAYGADIIDSYQQAGAYLGRILKGENPRDLPVVQPTKFELILNLKAANALGVTFPPKLLALADQVIE